MARELGVCVIGAGTMGTNHTRAWSKVKGVRLTALVDLDEARLGTLADEYGIENRYTDYRKALDRPDVDIVSVCVPAYFHPEMTIAGAERGKHVLCEKPIALMTEQARAMIEVARSNKVKLGIGFQLRQMQFSKDLRRIFKDGTVGRPAMWVYGYAWPIRQKLAMHDMLTGNGGPVVDFCPHRFDLWRQVFDSEAVAVEAVGLTLGEGRPELASIKQLAPDTVSLLVRYASGDLGSLHITWGLPTGVEGSSMGEIWSAKALVRPEIAGVEVLTEGGHKATLGPYGEDAMTDAMIMQAQAFVEAARGRGEPTATGEDGLAALQVSLAALRSAETAKPIDPRLV